MATPRKAPEDRLKLGRPTIYSEELADKICELLSINEGGLDDLCAKYKWLPNESTIRLWRIKYPDFFTKYLQAKQNQAHLYAESTIKIAEEKYFITDSEGNQKIDPGYVAWQKMNINLRQWHAAKLAPKHYGDKKQEEPVNSQETLSKIRDLVNDLNKTNTSDI